jgi:hypothetical protein
MAIKNAAERKSQMDNQWWNMDDHRWIYTLWGTHIKPEMPELASLGVNALLLEV